MKYSRITGVVEVYFYDLTEEARKVFLEAMGLKNEKEGNYDEFPIAELLIPLEEGGDDVWLRQESY